MALKSLKIRSVFPTDFALYSSRFYTIQNCFAPKTRNFEIILGKEEAIILFV